MLERIRSQLIADMDHGRRYRAKKESQSVGVGVVALPILRKEFRRNLGFVSDTSASGLLLQDRRKGGGNRQVGGGIALSSRTDSFADERQDQQVESSRWPENLTHLNFNGQSNSGVIANCAQQSIRPWTCLGIRLTASDLRQLWEAPHS
jgi:hypothetical protein